MAWDSRRPVPWRRLLIEWLVLGVVAGSVFALVSRDNRLLNGLSVVVGGGVYVLIAAVLAKFGYQRKTFKQLRADAQAAEAARRDRPQATTTAARRVARPAPTKRTNANSRHSARRK